MTEPIQKPAVAAPPEPPRDPRRLAVWSALALLGAVFFWNAWERDFWNPDEPRIALVAMTMEKTGDWLVPQIDGEPHLDLPPLAYWLPGLAHRLSDWDPRFIYRLPTVLVALFGLWLTYLAGKKLFDGRVGFLAVVIQASTYAYYRRATWLDDDLLFAVCCQLALTCLVLGARHEDSRRWSLLGWVGLAGAALAKSAFLAFGLVSGCVVLFLFLESGDLKSRTFLQDIDRMVRERRGEGLRGIVLSYLMGKLSPEKETELMEGMRADLHRLGVGLPAGYDPDKEKQSIFQAVHANFGTATCVVFNRRGELAWYLQDPQDMDRQLSRKVIERLLDE